MGILEDEMMAGEKMATTQGCNTIPGGAFIGQQLNRPGPTLGGVPVSDNSLLVRMSRLEAEVGHLKQALGKVLSELTERTSRLEGTVLG